MNKDWLQKLEAGSRVEVACGLGGTQHFNATVSRVTATQIVIGTLRFRRNDGGQVGPHTLYTPFISRLIKKRKPPTR